MLPQPLTLRQARRHWHECYNLLLSTGEKKQLTRRITRGTHAGTQQTVYVPRKPFSASCKDTGALLIKRALDAVHQLRQIQFLQQGQEVALAEGVVIEVNCVELGKKRSLSDRTMRTHLRQLLDAGLIAAKYFHGWRRNLELVISNEYLFEIAQKQQKTGPNTAGSAPRPTALLSTYGTKLPPIKALEKKDNTTLTDEVEKWTTQAPATRQEFSARPAGAAAAGAEARPEMGKPGARGGAGRIFSEKTTALPTATQPAPDAEKAALLALYGEELFTKAWKLLYPRHPFTAEQIERSRQAIEAGVYRHLDTTHLSLPQWQRYHAGCLQRVELAAKWFARHPDKAISAPYALYTNGKGYFDADNPNGFLRTEQWFVENEVKRHQRRIHDALQAAETEFSQFKQLQRGVKITASKRVKQATAWELYRWHENRIRQFGGRPALEKFYALTTAAAPHA